MENYKFKKGDKVLLPFKEKGKVVDFQEMMWFTRYYVQITESNGFNDLGITVDFFPKDMTLDIGEIPVESKEEKPKTWQTLKEGDPIYIIRYDHLKFPTFIESFFEESRLESYGLVISYHDEKLAMDENYEGTGYHFCVDLNNVDEDKYCTSDSYTGFFANLDAVYAEIDDFKVNYIDKLIASHKTIRKRLHNIFNTEMIKKLNELP
jgi:hypothetical protein